MKTVLRIIDTFPVQGRGMLYSVINETKDCVFRIGDTFFDLHGSQFKVTGMNSSRNEENTFEILLENTGGTEVQGSLLTSSSEINWLFCNHPLYQSKVDDDYKEEYEAAAITHSCALFSYEDLERGKLSMYGGEIQGLTVYRGWMMKPEMYHLLYEELKERGVVLINTPEQYKKYHMLPGWYEDFREDTAKSVWTGGEDYSAIWELIKDFSGSAIVKDYVKSRKHEWYDACFIEDIQNRTESQRVVDNFVNRQGDNLVGGIVIREFLELKSIGYHEKSGMPISEEYRVFIYGGRVKAVGGYWDNRHRTDLTEAEYCYIEKIADRVQSNFVTVDLARCRDGRLVIMELGDGQVSGLQQIEPKAFYSN